LPGALPSASVPTPDAAVHSARLQALIRAEIEQAGGWIDFARYMELALYAPGLGYYTAGSTKFGKSGDFVTAPEITGLFGRALGRQAAQVVRATGGDILELGAGSGTLAADLLSALAQQDAIPGRYLILELSADLRARQRKRIDELAPALASRVRWLEQLPAEHDGLILGNEVLDALAVHLVVWRDGGIYERGVASKADGFAWAERPLSNESLLRAARAIQPPEPYLSEISLAIPALIRTLSGILSRGVMLFIDYGFGARELYHPQRSHGTLMCHYQHRAHDDPFFAPGLQDITAHVDFTAVAQAGSDAGLQLGGYTTQAQLLINLGITELLSEIPVGDASAYLPRAAEAQKLLSPAEMGELFKAIALARGIDVPLLGFRDGDKTRLL
jgi:SAM-dependent MidA family methyltransferase